MPRFLITIQQTRFVESPGSIKSRTMVMEVPQDDLEKKSFNDFCEEALKEFRKRNGYEEDGDYNLGWEVIALSEIPFRT